MNLFRPEVLESRRTSWVGEIQLVRPVPLAWMTGAAVGVALALGAFLVLGEYTRKVRVAGVLVPDRGVIRLVAPQDAVLMERRVADGQQVRAGDVLFVLSLDRAAASGDTQAAVLRSLPSMPLRYAAHDAATRTFAAWCTTRPEFARVLHPALPGSPGHEHWKSHCRAAACLVSVVFAPDVETPRVNAFVEALKLFRIGYSWAGPVSLALPHDLSMLRPGASGLKGSLVRFSIGLEDVDDLIADVQQALGVLAA